MKFAHSFIIALFAPLVPMCAVAQSSSTLRLETAKPAAASTTEKDIDHAITDPALRAQLGSKSKWSFKSSFLYSGSAISDPFSRVRPNYRASKVMEEMTSLKGTLGVNFRATENDGISAGVGLAVIDPLHGDPMGAAQDTRENRSGDLRRYEVASPYISWNRGYRFHDLQMISGISYAQATSTDAVEIFKTFATVLFNQTVEADLGGRWATGTVLIAHKCFYSGEVTDPSALMMMRSGRLQRPSASVSLIPTLQYQLSDRYSLRTGFGYFQFVTNDGSEDVSQLEPFQSVGIGVSVTRDIYLAPRLDFTPRNIRMDHTNVAVLANMNLF